VLSLYLRGKNAFSNDHVRMLLAASSKLGLSVENALEFEKAQSSASTDFLTGLANARSICLHLESEISRSRRAGSPLGVLLCDLNGFKKVNDNYGHLTGNKLLQEAALTLKAACREYDQVGRLGGDEFVFVLPKLTTGGVAEVKHRLDRAIQEACLKASGGEIVSMSVGEAFYPADGTTAEQLLSEADKRMYEAKEKYYAGSGSAPPAGSEAVKRIFAWSGHRAGGE
jgi:diguanylate cyclase (GGDEF)-like protein